jgi:hypothetical protein
MHQAMHFEPVKYIDGVLFFVFKTPIILFLFRSIVFFLPILYLLKVFPVVNNHDKNFLILLSFTYCLYPSVQNAVSFDLRPFIFLGPCFFISFLAVCFNRPKWEILTSFNLMFLIREEALIFAIVIILYALADNYKEKSESGYILRSLLLSWIFWFTLILIYYRWSGYHYHLSSQRLFAFSMIPIVVLIYLFIVRKKLFSIKTIRSLAILSIFAPLGCQFYLSSRSSELTQIIKSLIFYPRWMLYFSCVLLVSIVLWQTIEKKAFKIFLLSCFSLVLAISVALNYFSFGKLSSYLEGRRAADLVFSLRDSTDKYNSHILCDYQTYQAFYDYENVYVYQRLPSYLISGEKRFYPANIAILGKLIKERIEYIIASNDKIGTILNLAEKLGVECELIEQNKRFSAYHLIG